MRVQNYRYKELIFSNHAIERMAERKVEAKEAWLTWYKPDQSRYAKSKDAWIYYKTWNGKKIEVVAKRNEKNEWIVLSVWSANKEEFTNKNKKPVDNLLLKAGKALLKIFG